VAAAREQDTTALITSAANPIVKRVRALVARRRRQEERAAVVHGIQPVWQAVEAGFEMDTLLVAPQLLSSAVATELVAEQERAGVRVARLSGELFTRLSDREHPSGLAAIVRTREITIDELALSPVCTVVAVHRLGNPGNLGTVLRTADATGAAGVLLVGPTADPWDPTAVKASMGAVFNVPVVRLPDEHALFDWAHRAGLTVVTTAARARHSLWRVRIPDRVVVLLGSEGEGLDDHALARGDLQVSIPMVGTAESLNVGVAASVLLYEIWRQRMGGGLLDPQLYS
jgi:RNA methyltransferase, TrmH family